MIIIKDSYSIPDEDKSKTYAVKIGDIDIMEHNNEDKSATIYLEAGRIINITNIHSGDFQEIVKQYREVKHDNTIYK